MQTQQTRSAAATSFIAQVTGGNTPAAAPAKATKVVDGKVVKAKKVGSKADLAANLDQPTTPAAAPAKQPTAGKGLAKAKAAAKAPVTIVQPAVAVKPVDVVAGRRKQATDRRAVPAAPAADRRAAAKVLATDTKAAKAAAKLAALAGAAVPTTLAAKVQAAAAVAATQPKAAKTGARRYHAVGKRIVKVAAHKARPGTLRAALLDAVYNAPTVAAVLGSTIQFGGRDIIVIARDVEFAMQQGVVKFVD